MRLAARLMSALLMAALILPALIVAPVAASGLTTHFQITGLAATETAGVADSITVNALTAGDTVDTTFAGTISFTSSDGSAILPGNGQTLTNGTGNFSVTLKIAGSQSVTVTEDSDTPTGTANTTVNAAAANHLVVANYNSPIVAGTPDGFDVAAKDAFNNIDTTYAGTVHFTSSDPLATVPADSGLTNGQGTFINTVLRTAGTQSITGTDTVTASITGSQVGISVTPAATTHFSVTGYPSPTVAGAAHNVTVTARDAYQNVTPAYAGTVHITSSDGAATLPANNTLASGTRMFSVTLNTVGTRSITATDTVTASITGTQAGITVSSAANNPPVAVNDSATIYAGSGYVPIDVLANDSDPDVGNVIHVTVASNPPHGSTLITGGGTGVSYRPDSNFVGTDTFTYTISDGSLTDSATVTVTVPKDTIKPVASAPNQTFSAQTIGTSTVKVRLTWTGTDQGSGINRFELWQSTNGGAYTRILTTVGHQGYVNLTPPNVYRFRVRAIDNKGNVGAMAYGPSFTAYRYQETSSSIVYSSPWQTLTSTVYSGGHAKSTTINGNDATFTTLSRTIAWVTTKSPTRGSADVYVDGVLKAHVILNSSTARYRYLAYSITFATSGVHSMRVVYTGASTKRADVDAFVFLR